MPTVHDMVQRIRLHRLGEQIEAELIQLVTQRVKRRRIRCNRFLIDDSVRTQRVILIDGYERNRQSKNGYSGYGGV